MLQLASMFIGYLNLLYSFPLIFLLKYVDFWWNKQEQFNDVRYNTNKIFTKEYFHKYGKETVCTARLIRDAYRNLSGATFFKFRGGG